MDDGELTRAYLPDHLKREGLEKMSMDTERHHSEPEAEDREKYPNRIGTSGQRRYLRDEGAAVEERLETTASIPDVNGFITKDSGRREEFASGMQRDTQEGKPRFDLLVVPGVPYEEQPLYRAAMLMARGAEKYGDHNWTLSFNDKLPRDPEELTRFKASAFRHFFQWICGEVDEDHFVATYFNQVGAEQVKRAKAIK